MVNLAKPNDLLSMLNQIKNDIQFTMEKSQRKLPFWDIMVDKSGTKIWMDIYNKQTHSKRYITITSNHPRQCLTNIPFSFARRMCIIIENENVKEKRFKKMKKKHC